MAVPGRARPPADSGSSSSLADNHQRDLDKGIVIAGDIRVNLLDIELLTIKIRLLVASVDKAREIGIDWWEHDPSLSSAGPALVEENRELRERVRALEARGAARRTRASSAGEGAPARKPRIPEPRGAGDG
jgi:hypothetical protein